MNLNLDAHWLCPLKKSDHQYKVGCPESINTPPPQQNGLNRLYLYNHIQICVTIISKNKNNKEKYAIN